MCLTLQWLSSFKNRLVFAVMLVFCRLLLYYCLFIVYLYRFAVNKVVQTDKSTMLKTVTLYLHNC